MPSSTPKINSKGFAHLLLIIGALIFFGTASAAVIKTTNEFPSQYSPSVLGEDEENKEDEKKAEEVRKEENKNEEEIKKDENKQRQEEGKKVEEIKKEELKKAKIDQKVEFKERKSNEFKLKTSSEIGKSETEIESTEGKFKSKIEDDDRVKVEIERGKLKIKFENGKLKIEREHEGTDEGKLGEDELNEDQEIKDEIEQELEDDGIEIATSSSGVIIKKNNRRARTSFPLSVNPETNELIVTTPAGQKAVTILPDQAVENMLTGSVLTDIDQVDGEDNVEIETRKDDLVYKVKGEKSHKFLGFIPLKTSITAFVSAQTGQLTAQEQSLLAQWISRLSF